MREMHSLAGRQARKYLAEHCAELPEMKSFLNAVSEAYWEFDEDRRMLERSLEISSQELLQANQELKNSVMDLQRMQDSLVHSEKMASIGQLTAGIAHEINNPLSFVTSNLHRFQEYFNEVSALVVEWQKFGECLREVQEYGPHLDRLMRIAREADFEFLREDFQALMGHTNSGAERIKSIVEQLRGFSHSSGREFTNVDLNQVMEDTLVMVWNELKYKATVIREFGQLPPVQGCSGELKQVFINLLVNAAHAIKEKGEIVLRTVQNNSSVTVLVSDNGCGIPPENLKKIFDPFYTTKPVGKGTGLGLWISTTIVRKHGGELGVESTVGKGTTFRVTLPVTEAA